MPVSQALHHASSKVSCKGELEEVVFLGAEQRIAWRDSVERTHL